MAQFFVDLTDIWLERGYGKSIAVGPIDELVKKFTDGSGCLPCIWQANCADEFISIDARGYVAQCDCWVTSYPEYFFGNIFQSESLGVMLKESSARKKFLERPAAIIPEDCIECDYLSLCHGGCPVRTFTFSGTMFEKDPLLSGLSGNVQKSRRSRCKAWSAARPRWTHAQQGTRFQA